MKKKYLYIITGLLLLFSIITGLCSGTEFINPFAIIENLLHRSENLKMEILLRIRLPRIFAAAFTGAALSVSGAVFQSVFRNPLADPFITGVSGGASLGISAAVVFALGPVATLFFSFSGSILAIVLLYLLSYGKGFGGGVFILAGVALSFIFSSSVMLLFSIAESQSVHKAIIWMMGDLSSSGDLGQGVVSLLIFAAAGLLWIYHRHLNIISLGRSFSNSSGVSDLELRIILILASVLSALSVILGGIIPFVGLMIPHLIRLVNGHDNESLIPLSAIGGASFLILSDAVSRSLIFPYEIPVGVITGFAGGIFFLFFVIRSRQVY
jgi:iron complex transport system permease protein